MSAPESEADSRDIDVAFSLLVSDEPSARDLADRLSGVSTFVFSRRQEEIAGADGVEALSAVFGTRSHLVVILYRDGWGGTPWTRLEEGYIKERGWRDGWDFLLVVGVGEGGKTPVWLPSTRIWFDLKTYGPDETVAAIRNRLRAVGVPARVETPRERALRQARTKARLEEQQVWLQTDAAAKEADDHFAAFIHRLDNEVGAMGGACGIHFRQFGRVYVVRSPGGTFSATWHRPFANSTLNAVLGIREFDGFVQAAEERLDPSHCDGSLIGDHFFSFDVNEVGVRGWREKHSGNRRFFTPHDLADHFLARLVARNDPERRPPSPPRIFTLGR